MFRIINSESVLRISDGVYIPFDIANADYQEYKKWIDEGNAPEPAELLPGRNSYEEWKVERQSLVDAIIVEVDGLVFDGDEVSQNRMARAVTAADTMDETTEWTLHDNAVATVTMRQLKQACRLAGEAQTAIWNDGRPAPLGASGL